MNRSRHWLPSLAVAALTGLVTAGLVLAGQPEAAAVWAGLSTVGAVLVFLRGRGAIWPFWAMLGLAAAAAGSYQTAAFNWISAAAGLVVALAVGAAALAGAALRSAGPESPLELAAGLARGLVGAGGPRWTVRPLSPAAASEPIAAGSGVTEPSMSDPTAIETRGGQLIRAGDPGPGATLDVPMGWVVATVRDNAFARLVDPSHGVVSLEPGETPFRAIAVSEQTVSGSVADPLSRDAVRIDRVDWALRYRLRALPESAPQPGDPYPYDPVAVKEAAWSPAPLESAVAAAAADALRDAIREHTMQALFQPEGGTPPLEPALASARLHIDARLRNWGHAFLGLSIRRVALSEDVQEHLTAVWHAKVERQVRSLHRQAEEAGRVPLVPPSAAAGVAETTESDVARTAGDAEPSPTGDAAYKAGSSEPGTSEPMSGAREGAHAPDSEASSAEAEIEVAQPPSGEAAALTPGGSSVEPATGNPVSFTQFLRTLQSRAAEGDDRADSVLRQVMDTMDRLGPTLGDTTQAADGQVSKRSQRRRKSSGSGSGATPPDDGQDVGEGGSDGDATNDASSSDDSTSGQQSRLL